MSGCTLNDCVRTNTDPKYLSCLIVDKIEKTNTFLYKLICQYGALENKFSEVRLFVNLKHARPNELKQIDVHNLKIITIIEASKVYSSGSTTGHTCNYRGNCMKKTCLCNSENY
jgi:hypothetical protein